MTRANPMLRGFHPDPSITRVGEDYYLATSTFEWFPGVRIYHSRDLSNWTLAATPLDRAEMLDMRGNPDSGGIWAPCLTHDGERFWLAYTNMRRHQGSVKDGMNFVTWAERIEGPWSAPVTLNATGFDPSFFHDDDGRSWLIQMAWEAEKDRGHFAGIIVQEFDREARRLTGPRHEIFSGTEIGLTEGPHLYKRDGWYHLLTAEGGTGYGHACTWARSRTLLGPYEVHPRNPILTSTVDPEYPLQKAGHGDIVEGPDGRWWLVHLLARPLPGRRSVLGRETGIAPLVWGEDGWPEVPGGPLPPLTVDLSKEVPPPTREETDFRDGLPPAFQWLRTPEPERIFAAGSEGLTLFGRESIGSWHEQALVARRQDAFCYSAETTMEFAPEDSRQQAGLTAYYSRHALYFLALTRLDGQRVLRIVAAEADTRGGSYSWPGEPVPVPHGGPVHLGLDTDRERLQFRADLGAGWSPVGPELDASILSDEASVATGGGCFTGAFVGLVAVDMNGTARPARFRRFLYERRPG